MVLKDKKISKEYIHEVRRFNNSVKYSLNGLKAAYTTERSLMLHLAVTILVFVCAFIFKIDRIALVLSIIMMGAILAIELINTAIESAVDLCTYEINPYAKKAKDCASSASFVFSIVTLISEVILFYPYIVKFFS